jgi:hypothetical protein
MRSFIFNFLDQLSNIKWDTKYYINVIFKPEFRKAVHNNKSFKNLHTGQRCFIVGNGPSLNKLDLTKLKDEITFTVNNIMQDRVIYESLNPNYHVFIDPIYYNLNPDVALDKTRIELLKSINYQNNKPICLTSIEGYKAYQKYGLNNHLRLFYLYQHKTLTTGFSGEIDLSKNIPSSQNVIQAAIFAAIYMGFKEIYLIGCDMTSIFLTFESNAEGEKEITKEVHAYKYSESEKKSMQRDSKRHDNEFLLTEYAKTFLIYKRIKTHALKNNIQIINATPGGGLDVFSRTKYESLFTDF